MIKEVAVEFSMTYKPLSEEAVDTLRHLTIEARVEGGEYPRRIMGEGYIVECKYDEERGLLDCKAFADEEGARKLVSSLFNRPFLTSLDRNSLQDLVVRGEGDEWECEASPDVFEIMSKPGIRIKTFLARAEGDFDVKNALFLLVNLVGDFPILESSKDRLVAIMGDQDLPCLVKISRHEAEVKCQRGTTELAERLDPDEPVPIPFFTTYEMRCRVSFDDLDEFLIMADRAEDLLEDFKEKLLSCEYVDEDLDYMSCTVNIYGFRCSPEPIKWYPFILR